MQSQSGRLAIFDLDDTLLAGDSDYAWGQFLISEGEVDAELYRARNDAFFADYKAGELDIEAYLKFSCEPLTRIPIERLHLFQKAYMEQVIEPMILQKGVQLLDQHRSHGDHLMINTATIDFVTAPIAERLGVDSLIAPRVEYLNGRYTGRVVGTASYRDGKVARLNDWLQTHPYDLRTSAFYSDSHNDLPLLSLVGNPCCVDPDDRLRAEAKQRGWPILSLRA